VPPVGRARRVLVAVASFGGIATVGFCWMAGPAAAEVDGGCTGQASFPELDGQVYTAEDTGVLVVPIEDTVTYEGTVPVPEGTERTHNGEIRIDLPLVFDAFDPVIADWGTETDASSDTGTYHYDIPDFVPRGVELRLYGEHNDEVDCTGEVTIELEGGVGDAPLIPAVAVIGTVASGAGVAVAMRGRP
jgi:hypothetical protein